MRQPGEVIFLKAAAAPSQYPAERLPEVAFAGRSNVGKSSLLNTLVGRKMMARVSRTPGKTQLITFYRVDGRFHLVDLPGYGYAKVPMSVQRRWRPMIEQYLGSRRSLCLVTLILDIRRIPTEQDLQLKTWLERRGIPTAYVLTKSDKISRGARSAQLRMIAGRLGVPPELPVVFSSRNREGRQALWKLIHGAVRQKEAGEPIHESRQG